MSLTITDRILDGMIVPLFYGTAAEHNWIWSAQMRHTAFGAIGEICTLEVPPNLCSELYGVNHTTQMVTCAWTLILR